MFKVGDKVIANGKKGTITSVSGDFVSVLYSSNTSDITHKNNVSHDFQIGEWVEIDNEPVCIISKSGPIYLVVDLMGEKYEKHVSNLVKLRGEKPDCKCVIAPKDTIIMRNVIKYQVFDTQLNKVVNTFDTLKDAEDTLYRLNKSAINIGEEFENSNIAVKVENVDLVAEKVEVVIHHCGQPFYSSYDLSKFLREFKKCVQ